MKSLWDEALDLCVERLREQHKDSNAINQFLQDKASVQEALQSAELLRKDSDRKYGQNESRGKGVSGKWIRRIMDNIDQFTKYANVAMAAAPQSVGLAWFAISQVLGAVQNDYKLYGIFNGALNDITEMMVLIKTYDDLYRASSIGKDGSIYEDLCKGIRELYASILDFSYAVKEHITGGKTAKFIHAMQDVVGQLNRAFEAKTSVIQAQKIKVVQAAEAAFQRKTRDQLDSVSSEIRTIHDSMQDFFDFHKKSTTEWKEILSELKSAKPLTHYEVAIADHEKKMKALTPWLDQSVGLLTAYLKEREAGTCEWILEHPAYVAWYGSEDSSILSLAGEMSCGKSVLAAFIHNKLESSVDNSTLVQYVSQNATSKDGKGDSIDRIENTIIRELYKHALDGTEDDLLLQRCNSIFARPIKTNSKEASGGGKPSDGPGSRARNTDSDVLPDLLDTYPSLLETLQKRVFLIIDVTNVLSEEDQLQFAERVLELNNTPSIKLRMLLICRSSSSFQIKLREAKVSQILVPDHTEDDIKLVISQGVKNVPNLSKSERIEIEEAIRHQTGHRIRYVRQVALPFLHTPLQRPVKIWLKDLPINLNETYNQHLQQLTPNYRRLLLLAVGWTLIAHTPPTVDEIMDTYSQLYLEGDALGRSILNEENLNFYGRQIQHAGGPFLDIHDGQFIVLQDPQAVRDFFTKKEEVSRSIEARPPFEDSNESNRENETCVISEKIEQLKLALVCFRHLNSKSFQTRFLSGHLEEAEKRAKRRLGQEESSDLDDKEAGHDVPSKVQPGDQIAEHVINLSNAIEANTEEMGVDKPIDEIEANHVNEKDEESDTSGDPDNELQGEEEDRDDDDSVFTDQDDDLSPPEWDDDSWDDTARQVRYEILNWQWHVRQAESLWSTEERKTSLEWQQLMKEMEKFFIEEPVGYEAWKLYWVAYEKEEWDPILFAAEFGLISLAELLIDRGVEVTDQFVWGLTAFHVACRAPNAFEILHLFLEHGADPNFEGSCYTTPFYYWIMNDTDAECVKEFLVYGASCNVLDRDWQANVLHWIGESVTDTKVLDLVLETAEKDDSHMDINLKDMNGETPLHWLLRRQEIPIGLLERFLFYGADVNVNDRDQEQPLYESASWAENKVIKTIIERVTDVDNANTWGRTALHAAAWTANSEGVDLLLTAGADPNRKDKHNRTPLLFSCLHHYAKDAPQGAHQRIAEQLLEKQLQSGASFEDINPPTKRGRTPLREAAGRGFVRVVTMILDQMKDEHKDWINKKDDQRGRTPLHSAAAHGHGDVVTVLLKYGANPSIRDGEHGTGLTSLQLCLDRWNIVGLERYADAIAHLIDASIEEARSSRLLLTTAAIYGSIPVLEKLSKLGVNLETPDDFGWTPKQLAAQFEQKETEAFIRRTIAAAALRPTKWMLDPLNKITVITEEGVKVSHDAGVQLCLIADRPIPAESQFYYFETEILDYNTGDSCSPTPGDQQADIIALGFCTTSSKLFRFPGWPPKGNAPNAKSWAYHGDDGGFYASDAPSSTRFGLHYGPGDVIGCGVRLDAQKIFFTRNGEELDYTFDNIKGRLFPILGLEDQMKVRTNFGNDLSNTPFKWNPPTEGGK